MFLTTNNEVIGSLKSPPAMVFRRKLTVCPPASRLLLPFVSSELGKKQLFHTYLCKSQNYQTFIAVDDPMHCLQPSAPVPSNHPQHLRVIHKVISTVAQSRDALNTADVKRFT